METIEAAAEHWECNKTRALMLSADLARRIDPRIREVLARDDLTPRQKREIAATLSVPNLYELEVGETVAVERGGAR